MSERNAKSKILNASLVFFAIVGFLASVVTVLEYLRPATESSLSVDLFPYEFRTPHYSGQSMQNGEPARRASASLSELFCIDLDENQVRNTERADLTEFVTDDVPLDQVIDCKNFTEIEFASRWNGEYSSSERGLYKYVVTNNGRSVAEDIRIQAADLNSLQYRRGTDFIDVEKSNDEEYFALPELNPNETLEVLAWTSNSSFLPMRHYAEADDYPRVTFAGSRVSTNLYKMVPYTWYEFSDFVDSAPLLFLIVFLIVGAVIVLLALWLVVAVPMALVTGKPLNQVFVAEKDDEVHDLHVDEVGRE